VGSDVDDVRRRPEGRREDDARRVRVAQLAALVGMQQAARLAQQRERTAGLFLAAEADDRCACGPAQRRAGRSGTGTGRDERTLRFGAASRRHAQELAHAVTRGGGVDARPLRSGRG